MLNELVDKAMGRFLQEVGTAKTKVTDYIFQFNTDIYKVDDIDYIALKMDCYHKSESMIVPTVNNSQSLTVRTCPDDYYLWGDLVPWQ